MGTRGPAVGTPARDHLVRWGSQRERACTLAAPTNGALVVQ